MMLVNRTLCEGVATFALVFFGAGAIVINDISGGALGHLGVSAVFGLIVMSMIYAIGDVSGAHLNPAVTVAFWVARRFPGREVLPYIGAQVIGAVCACLVLVSMFPLHKTLGATRPADSWPVAFVLEVILTFFLMFVILHVSTGAKEKGLLAGIAIGGTVCLAAAMGGPISGAAMNPARSIGPGVVAGIWGPLWIYITAPILGALLAVPACRWIRGDACCTQSTEAAVSQTSG